MPVSGHVVPSGQSTHSPANQPEHTVSVPVHTEHVHVGYSVTVDTVSWCAHVHVLVRIIKHTGARGNY